MQWTTNSGEAVSGLAGLSGTFLVSALILLVIGLVSGVVAVGFHKKAQQSAGSAAALGQVVRAAGAAAVIAGSGALFMTGAGLYSVPKVEAQRAAPVEAANECSESRTVTISSGVWEDQFSEAIEDPGLDQPIASGEAQYYPDPANGCDNGTVDPCRMVHLTGTTGDTASMTGFEKLDQWVKPKGECSSGEPEEVKF